MDCICLVPMQHSFYICNDCLGSLVYWHLCSGLLIRFGRIQIFKSCSNHKVTKIFERSQVNMVESVNENVDFVRFCKTGYWKNKRCRVGHRLWLDS